jgi:hypothetical protein
MSVGPDRIHSGGLMTPKATTPPTFSSEQLTQILSLIKDSDSVELKFTVPESDQRSTVVALGMDPLEAQIRQVFFFETPDLKLDKAGVVVRARRIQGKGNDSVVKLRPVEPADMPAKLRRSAGFRVEVDALPGGFVCSGTMKGMLGPTDVRRAVAGDLPVRKLFSKEQRAFYAAHAPEGVALDDLTILGPILVLKLRMAPKELNRRLVAEVWVYPDGSRVLELSTRCGTTEGFQVAAELRAFLGAQGVEISGEQETKTRKALEYFAETFRNASVVA